MWENIKNLSPSCVKLLLQACLRSESPLSQLCNLRFHLCMNYLYLLTLQVIADQSLWAVCGKQGAVVNLTQNKKQNIVVEVMPRVGGHLPLPTIRLSKVQIK